MRTYSKLILAALAASALLALAVSGASARNFSVNERNFELIWNSALGAPKTKLRFIAAGRSPVECNVTLLGRYSANTIAKRSEINQGSIAHGELESCTGGNATIKTETMPWNLRYRSFTGELPIIRSITTALIGATYRIQESGGATCESTTEANHPGIGIIGNSAEANETGLERTGEAENITAERRNRIPLGGEGFLCSIIGEGEFGGIGLIRNLPRTAKIRVTLI